MNAEDELLRAALIVHRRMTEEGCAGDVGRVPEFVDSLLESARSRFPDVMTDPVRFAVMREGLYAVVRRMCADLN